MKKHLLQTKYIKVNTADRLPEKSGIYPVIFNLGGETIVETVNYEHELGFYAENTDCHLIDEWLEEVPDKEEEMREMLENTVFHFQQFEKGYETIPQRQLIDKIKEFLKQ